jgi:thiol-disulfide isomerase/thioredoxin
MNRILIALIGTLFWFVALTAGAAEPPMVMNETPKPLPEINFTDGTGHARTLAEFRGKVVLLNIWATWCGPCRKEMPTLDRLQAALGGPDFEVVPLSIDRKGLEAVDKFYAEIGIQHLARYLAPSSSEVFDKLSVFGLPATFLIDRQGRELARRDGPAEWDSPDMIAFFKTVIAKQMETSP